MRTRLFIASVPGILVGQRRAGTVHVLFEHCPYKQSSLTEHVGPMVLVSARLNTEGLMHFVL